MLRQKRLVDVDARNRPRSRVQTERQKQRQEQHSQSRFQQEFDDNHEDLEDRWRQAAQMLSDDDEIDELFNNSNTSAHRQHQSHRSSPNNSSPINNENDDDNSSLSFTQSGCHSILSAWRLKSSLNRGPSSRAASSSHHHQHHRPTSVLSNTSSVGKKSATSRSTAFTNRGKSPASQSRIALGPRQAQHFVTNTRRRRQANELILTTLEARRRALALNRQNASLFGSASYLADPSAIGGFVVDGPVSGDFPLVSRDHHHLDGDFNARLSLSPSPIGRKTPSPAPRRSALSDLGGRQSSATGVQSLAAQAQRQRLLMSAKHTKSDQQRKRPPLAKLDQNSSDLYSSNCSSSSSSESSTSGSQFTQLVTSELAPDCVLLDEQALRSRAASNQQQRAVPFYRHQPMPPPKPVQSDPIQPPKVPTRRKQQKSASPAATGEKKRQQDKMAVLEESGGDQVGKLRRGALRRDSIRRLRLNRAPPEVQQSNTTHDTTSSSDVAPSSSESSSSTGGGHKQQQQALSKTRRLDIESNPFLNRHHFRTTSARARSGSETAPEPEPAGRRSGSAASAAAESQAGVKRNSWRLSSAREPHRVATSLSRREAAIGGDHPVKPRFFSEARKSSSSEAIHRAGGRREPHQAEQEHQQSYQRQANKVDKQSKRSNYDGQEEENIRQVERMLRQMRPNQVFTSYAKESESVKSQQAVSETTTSGNNNKLSSLPFILSAPSSQNSATKTTTTVRTSSPQTTSGSTRAKTVPKGASSFEFHGDAAKLSKQEAATKLQVREGTKSRDDLRFDTMGNRKQFELEERWRHEKTHNDQPVSGKGGSTSRSEERLISERMEIMRSSSISPPVEFADYTTVISGARATQSSARSEPPPRSARESSTVGARPTHLATTQYKALQQQRQQQTIAGVPLIATRRSLSEEKPPVVARRRPIAGASAASSYEQRQSNAPTSGRQHSVLSSQVGQANNRVDLSSNNPSAQLVSVTSLPKFERTADDEFKKRVDYLRKLARANLAEGPSAQQQQVGGGVHSQHSGKQVVELQSRPQSLTTTTKPMTTNWRRHLDDTSPQRATTTGSTLFADERAKWNFGPLAGRDRDTQVSPPPARGLATTNLDSALLSDRYQSSMDTQQAPVATKWRRSNSSLASLTQQQVAPTKRPTSPQLLFSTRPPPANMSTISMSTNSPGGGNKPAANQQQQQQQQQQREMTSSAVVKLVVKEKSAPKLDYAFVEQQPSGAQQVVTAVRQTGSHVAQPQVRSSGARVAQTSLASATTRTRSPLRMASPRSPEFGVMAASSNDDSAIASSVSSPSLSFMMNTDQRDVRAAAAAAAAAAATSARSASPVSSKLQQHTAGMRSKPNQNQDSVSGGALQSILRRHQQHSGDSSDSSAAQQHATTGSSLQQQQVGARLESSLSNVSPGKRAHGGGQTAQHEQQTVQPKEPLFRSDARSPDDLRGGGSHSGGAQSPDQHLARTLVGESLSDSCQSSSAAANLTSSPPKRVHFNDRTSIRSFESISSLASNSTAVPTNDLLRQQVGSPDSMGSGSTSRLSGDSPDLRKGGGAAIYAVRGDPELDLDYHHHHQGGQHPLVGLHPVGILQQPPYGGEVHMQHHAPYAPPISMSGQSQPMAMPIQQHQHRSQFIRMTAPPSISTNLISTSAGIPSPPQSSPHTTIQYIVRPTSLTTTQIVPTKTTTTTTTTHHLHQQQQQHDDDEEDPNYALRLRQAATSRVFANYVAAQPSPPVIPAHSHQQQQQRQPAHLSPGGQSAQQQQQSAPSRRSLAMDDLLNFQTEV